MQATYHSQSCHPAVCRSSIYSAHCHVTCDPVTLPASLPPAICSRAEHASTLLQGKRKKKKNGQCGMQYITSQKCVSIDHVILDFTTKSHPTTQPKATKSFWIQVFRKTWSAVASYTSVLLCKNVRLLIYIYSFYWGKKNMQLLPVGGCCSQNTPAHDSQSCHNACTVCRAPCHPAISCDPVCHLPPAAEPMSFWWCMHPLYRIGYQIVHILS